MLITFESFSKKNNNNNNISKNIFKIFDENENDLTRKLNNSILLKKFNIFSLILISLSHDDNIKKIKQIFYHFSLKFSKILLILILINYYV